MHIDPDLPETGRLAWLARRLNRIYAVLRSLQPINTPGTKTSHTVLGVKREVQTKKNEGGDNGGDARWS